MDIKQVLADHVRWLLGKPDGKRADLSWANLPGANLSGANLSGAYLSGIDLFGAILLGAYWDDNIAKARWSRYMKFTNRRQ